MNGMNSPAPIEIIRDGTSNLVNKMGFLRMIPKGLKLRMDFSPFLIFILATGMIPRMATRAIEASDQAYAAS